MTHTQFLLWKLSEECNEIGQQASKCAIFGLMDQNVLELEKDPNYPPNEEIVAREIDDLIGILELLYENRILRPVNRDRVMAKKEKVLKWAEYSKNKGILAESALEILKINARE